MFYYSNYQFVCIFVWLQKAVTKKSWVELSYEVTADIQKYL